MLIRNLPFKALEQIKEIRLAGQVSPLSKTRIPLARELAAFQTRCLQTVYFLSGESRPTEGRQLSLR